MHRRLGLKKAAGQAVRTAAERAGRALAGDAVQRVRAAARLTAAGKHEPVEGVAGALGKHATHTEDANQGNTDQNDDEQVNQTPGTILLHPSTPSDSVRPGWSCLPG